MKVTSKTQVQYTENNQKFTKEYNQSESYYDAYGHLLLQLVWNASANTWVVVQQNHFDTSGRPIYSVDASGEVSTIGYDAWSNVSNVSNSFGATYFTEYNMLLRKQTSYVMNGSAKEQAVVSEMDPWGRVIKKTAYNNPTNLTGALSESFTYDFDNNLVKYKDPKNNETSYGYDVLNRLVRVTNPLNQTSEYSYTKLGDIGQIKLSEGATSWTTTKTFDERGLLRSHQNPGNQEDTYTYNALGLQQSYKDPNGNVFNSDYDQWNRQTKKETTGQKYTTQYNEVPYGPLKAIEWNGNTEARSTTFQYGGMGLVQGITDTYDGITQKQSYTYDVTGKLTKLQDPYTSTTQYQYDKTRPKCR